jgi:hypothetical protein
MILCFLQQLLGNVAFLAKKSVVLRKRVTNMWCYVLFLCVCA